ALTPVRSRSYKLLRGFMIDMLQSVNILPVLHRSRSWMNAAIRAELTDNYEKARIVAASMAHNAVNRREEPEMLLEWTVLFLTMLKMIDLLERAQTHYSDAAKVQYAADADGFRAQLEACCLELREIARLSDALVRWTALMIEREHAAPEEGWWVNRVGQDILDRAAMLEAIGKDNSRALVNFNVFLRLEPQLPFVPRYMKKQLRW
ncbi:MAG: hypothetical protein K0Q59_4631, partial [Paenibacillus sp.]|nr:hypothetical protein [Paenibacillus sp.]